MQEVHHMDIQLEKLDPCRWLIPKTGRMRVPGLLFSNEYLLKDIRKDQSLVQVCNVATMPGIVGYSLAMPDMHWGYGFPIGGVAAFDLEDESFLRAEWGTISTAAAVS